MPATTKADPVAEAEAALTAATEAERDARQRGDDLRQRLLSGDTSVTAEDLAAAGHSHEHAALGVEAAQLQLQAAEKAARRERLATLADEIAATAGDPGEVAEAVKAIEEAVVVILTAERGRYQNMNRWIATMRREGIPEYEPHGKERTDGTGRTRTPYKVLTAENAYLGWQPAAMGHGDQVFIGDRRISDISPGFLIRAGIERACRRVGGRMYASLGLENGTHPDLVDDPERWLRERY